LEQKIVGADAEVLEIECDHPGHVGRPRGKKKLGSSVAFYPRKDANGNPKRHVNKSKPPGDDRGDFHAHDRENRICCGDCSDDDIEPIENFGVRCDAQERAHEERRQENRETIERNVRRIPRERKIRPQHRGARARVVCAIHQLGQQVPAVNEEFGTPHEAEEQQRREDQRDQNTGEARVDHDILEVRAPEKGVAVDGERHLRFARQNPKVHGRRVTLRGRQFEGDPPLDFEWTLGKRHGIA